MVVAEALWETDMSLTCLEEILLLIFAMLLVFRSKETQEEADKTSEDKHLLMQTVF